MADPPVERPDSLANKEGGMIQYSLLWVNRDVQEVASEEVGRQHMVSASIRTVPAGTKAS